MKSLLLFTFLPLFLFAQAPDLSKGWKIKMGDDAAWAAPNFDDSTWKSIDPTTFYENQGYDGYNGYSWYRIKFKLSSSIKSNSVLKDSIRIIVGRVDDIDATYLNGIKIGSIGRFPEEPGGALGFYDKIRRYALPANHPALHWDAENTIAVRVFDGGGGGGLWGMTPSIDMVDVIDFVNLNIDAGGFVFSEKDKIKKTISIENKHNGTLEGSLLLKVKPKKGKAYEQVVNFETKANTVYTHTFTFPTVENAKVTYTFTEKNTKKTIAAWQITPYILTPKESATPKITNATEYGASPNTSFLWAIRATGARPMTFEALNLPKGLELDPSTGIIKGQTSTIAEYNVTLITKNQLGKAEKKVKVVIGDQLALTPPMGWNSWNCWAMSVSEDKVKQSADAMIKSGLVNHGWTYLVIDDGWQGKIGVNGAIASNEKFPNMTSLSQYLHNQGLKFGIYSSPGEISCGGLQASLGHEQQDAKQWADWGVDYLKYDWCSYNQFLGKPQNEWTESEQILPFKKMSDALKNTKRDIVFSVCNWGMNDVWKWGNKTGGQLWRTSGDIEDSWASLSAIGFAQPSLGEYAGKGAWNDPDMLIVGWVGWGDKLHQTHLTPSEQYTHISIWSLLSAPMMIGCDISKLDAFTYNLLANDEIIAINQDRLGKVAKVIFKNENVQVWIKDLADGSKAIGIFNLKTEDQKINLNWSDLGLNPPKTARDVWRQKTVKQSMVLNNEIPAHGCNVFIIN